MSISNRSKKRPTPQYDTSEWQTNIDRIRQRCEAINERLTDIEDLYLADQRMKDLASGRSQRHTVDQNAIDTKPQRRKTIKRACYAALGAQVLFIAVGIATIARKNRKRRSR